MRRYGTAFAALSVLAVAVFAAGTLALNAVRDSARLSGEVLTGERSAAQGVTLSRDMSLADHLLWDTSWDSGAGTGETDTRWKIEDTWTPDYYSNPGIEVIDVLYTGTFCWYDGDIRAMPGSYEAILEDLLGGRWDTPSASGEFLLNDYVGNCLLNFETELLLCDDSNPADEHYSQMFRLPLPREVRLSVTYEYVGNRHTASFTMLDPPQEGDIYRVTYTESDSVFAPSGYLYFVFATRDIATDELLDGSGLPGGGWGVYRVPVSDYVKVEPLTNSFGWVSYGERLDDLTGRWWAENSFRATANLRNAENVHVPGADWDGAWLELSHDGESVLLFTIEGGRIYLTVLDAETAAETQRLELCPDGGEARFGKAVDYGYCADGEYAVFSGIYEDEDVVAVTARRSGGRYEPIGTVELERPELPGLDVKLCYAPLYAYDGERLCVLQQLAVSDGEERETPLRDPIYGYNDFENVWLLRIYSGGEQVYSELIRGEHIGFISDIAAESGISINGAELSVPPAG